MVWISLGQTRKALRLAAKANAAAVRANRIARDVGEQQIRAYLGLGPINWISHYTNPEKTSLIWRFHVSLKNSGQTPARGLHVRTIFAVTDASEDVPSDLTDVDSISASIGPAEAIGIGKFNVSSADFVLVQKGEKLIYLIVEAVYKNSINAKSRHVTKIALRSGAVTGNPALYYDAASNAVDIEFHHIRGMNCLDEECEG